MKRKPLQDYQRLLQTCYGGPATRRGRRGGKGHTGPMSVTARGFDDGRGAVAEPPPDVAPRHGLAEGELSARFAEEYDCAANNERFDAARYEDDPGPREGGPVLSPPQPAQDGSAAEAGAAYRAPPPASADTSPGLDDSPPPTPARQRQSPPPAAAAASLPPRSGAAASAAFTQGQLKHLVKNEEMLSDLQSILNGGSAGAPSPKPAPPPPSPPPTSRAASQPSELPPPAQADKPNEHAIFDRITQNMRYATAYDLGSVALERHFDSLERMEASRQQALHRRTVKAAPIVAPPYAAPSSYAAPPSYAAPQQPAYARAAQADAGVGADAAPPAAVAYGPQQFVPITTQHANDANWPPRPAGSTIRQYGATERREAFGDFEYEAVRATPDDRSIRILGSWVQDNIVTVPIPQLTGKMRGTGATGAAIRRGEIEFHRDGRQALIDLWQEWEDAGLMDRVVTFSAGFVPRFMRGQSGSVSNHAWGIAFDINVYWNRLGDVPALVGEPGCVRELVDIANRHGFFWGGHFGGGRIDGMHFELGLVGNAATQ